MSELRIVDGYIMSRRGDDEVLPEMEERKNPPSRGGLVLTPIEGVVDNIAVIDLKSLYPSSIITANISRETKTYDPDEADVIIPDVPGREEDVGGEITEDDIGWDLDDGAIGFTLDEEGIIPEYLRELFPRRERKKELRDQYEPGHPKYEVYDRQQSAIKVIMNSFFGVANMSPVSYFRLGAEGLGEAITGLSRYVLWRSIQIVEEMGYEVLYSDTDSCFISFPEDMSLEEIKEETKELTRRVNESLDVVADDIGLPETHPFISGTDLHGYSDRHCFFYEFEKVYSKYLQAGKKKRYAGHIVWKEGKSVDKTEVSGFESRRSDSPRIAAEVQREVIEMILKGRGFDAVSDYVNEQIDVLTNDFETRDHALPSVINKPVEEYPNRPMPRAVTYSNEHLGYDWVPGDSPWLVYVDETAPSLPPNDVIAIDWTDDIPEGFTVDRPKMVEKCFQQPLSTILDLMGWSWREVKSGNQTTSLEGW